MIGLIGDKKVSLAAGAGGPEFSGQLVRGINHFHSEVCHWFYCIVPHYYALSERERARERERER